MRSIAPGNRGQENPFERGKSVGKALNACEKRTLKDPLISVRLAETRIHLLALTASQVFRCWTAAMNEDYHVPHANGQLLQNGLEETAAHHVHRNLQGNILRHRSAIDRIQLCVSASDGIRIHGLFHPPFLSLTLRKWEVSNRHSFRPMVLRRTSRRPESGLRER